MTDIVILNGTSSSGKSTLAKALQQSLDAPWLYAGIDNYIFMLPKQYLNPPLWSDVFAYEYEGESIKAIKTGPLGFQLVSAMHRSIAALATAGFNVIVDHVLLEDVWLDDMKQLFRGFQVWLIGVRCPLSVLEQRERDRKDRTLGQARAQYDVVHVGKVYDYEVDTSLATPETCARQIIAHMRHDPKPAELGTL